MNRFYKILAAISAAAFVLTACGGGGGGGSSNPPSVVPPVAQTPAPPPSTGGQSLGCPSSGPAAASIALEGGSSQSSHRAPAFDNGASRFVPGLITVTYTDDAVERSVDAAASASEAHLLPNMRLNALGIKARVFSVDPARTSEAIARLRRTPGVMSVEQAQYRHAMATVNPNDPYYRGFNGPVAPYYETSTTPGQWDMHVINLGTAWGYYASLPARGAAIAIIDTGVDVTHPDLKGGRIIRQHCYVTYPSNTPTSGSFAIDTDGHGTNVAGIADADTNNGFGFAGVAYDAPLLVYRIFPTTPSGGCEGSTSAQCSTTDVDEANAINDAVSHGAKVINLSLGATGPLSNCKDTVEENAIEAAIQHGVVVVAASGNESNASLDCPAAYPGVIAVGAEGPAGSNNAEAVATYSNYSSASGPGSGGIYLVAPGGTASTSSDTSDLHFVENITSSEMASASTYCKTDFAGAAGDCRGGFSGTSQATPHVAGVASLMLGLRPNLTPAQIASDLCATAHSIGDAAKQGCGRVDAAAAVAKALTQ